MLQYWHIKPIMSDLVSDNIAVKTWLLFYRTAVALYGAASKRLRPAGVSPGQARVLLVLSESSSPPTGTEISRIVGTKPHTITVLLNGMQRAGLIRRIKDDKNRKLVRVVMTQKGKKAWKQVLQIQLGIELTSLLSSEEFYQLDSILEKLLDGVHRGLQGQPVSGGK
jgi:DNA-binding MarR family transcriptional regulator